MCGAQQYLMSIHSQLNKKEETIMANVDISVLDNGPFIVKGDFTLTDGDQQPYPKQEQVALCRCGASGNKPFCDGSHNKAGFESAERAPQE